jgi:hypothetical protein
MFSLPAADPWPADRSCQARLKMFRHREPFVRLAVLKARPPDSTVRDSPRGLIGEFLPLFTCCCPRGFAAGVDVPCPSVTESGGLPARCPVGRSRGSANPTTASQVRDGEHARQSRDFRRQHATFRSSHAQHNGFLTCQFGGRICSSTAHEETICRIVWSEAQGQS